MRNEKIMSNLYGVLEMKCRYCDKEAKSTNGHHCRNPECFIKDLEKGK